jgi:hypothetical protein
VADHEVVQGLIVHVGVYGLLADESADVLGQLRVFDQWQRFVERLNEPPLSRGEHDVEDTDDV